MTENLLENGSVVAALREAMSMGKAGLSTVPMLLKRTLRDGCWKKRIEKGNEVGFERFEEFVTTAPIEGLGADMKLIKRLCGADTETLSLLDKAVQNEPCKHAAYNNVQGTESAPTGNSEQQALRKLRKDRTDLHAQVLNGELSAHAAMVKAGFRKRSLTIPVEPEGAARRIKKNFTPEQARELGRLLLEP